MKVAERIQAGLTGIDKACEPYSAEEFNALLDLPASEFNDRETRILSTMLLYIEGGRQTHNDLRDEIQKHIMLNGILKAKEIRKDHYIERMIPLLKMNVTPEAKAAAEELMRDMQNEYGERVPLKEL